MGGIGMCLWFDGQAEEAADFYVSLFPDSEVTGVTHYPHGAPGPAGSVLTVTFRLQGVEFTALNGGPVYEFTPATSIVATCDTQDEIDRLWAELTRDGREIQCGWLVDRFGVSWQVVPEGLPALLGAGNEGADRAFAAMLPMKKLEMDVLRRAYEGE